MHIISITIEKRIKEVPEVQKILTEYGDNIISRLGLHDIGENKSGLIIIVYEGTNVEEFIKKLKQIEKIQINIMAVK